MFPIISLAISPGLGWINDILADLPGNILQYPDILQARLQHGKQFVRLLPIMTVGSLYERSYYINHRNKTGISMFVFIERERRLSLSIVCVEYIYICGGVLDE